MTLPKKDFKIRVSPYTISVIYTKKLSAGDNTRGAVEAFGDWNFPKLQIRLSSSMNTSPHHLENTFLHELIHAMWDISGLSEFYDKGNKKVSEELLAERLSHSLQMFFQDNPTLLK